MAFLRGLAARRTCRHAQLLGVEGCRPTSVDTPADAPTPWGAVVQRDGRREVMGRLRAGLAQLPPGFPRLRFVEPSGCDRPLRCRGGRPARPAPRGCLAAQRSQSHAHGRCRGRLWLCSRRSHTRGSPLRLCVPRPAPRRATHLCGLAQSRRSCLHYAPIFRTKERPSNQGGIFVRTL